MIAWLIWILWQALVAFEWSARIIACGWALRRWLPRRE